MLKTWKNVSIDVDVLTKMIDGFFRTRNFYVQKRGSGIDVVINVFNKVEKTSFIVKIHGGEDFLEVEFASKEPVSLRFFSNFFSAFGGGYFALKRLKSEEFVEKLERDFWMYMSEMVAKMGCVKA
jgi:hypothetical protein